MISTFVVGTTDPDKAGMSTQSSLSENFDVNKSMYKQLLHSKISPETYDKFVNTPKPGACRLFESNFLEFFTNTPWFVVPLVWLPVVCVLMYFGSQYILTWWHLALWFALGLFIWTLMEYVLHRWVFHSEPYLSGPGFFMAL